jgi:hypothetical protein
MMPSQLTSTQSAESVQRLGTAITSGDSQNSGWPMPQVMNATGQAQVAGNVNWGTALQGDTSMGWGMMGQSNNMSMPWGGAPAQGATYNMSLTMPIQPNAVPNMGWVANPGNTNVNMMWTATQGQGAPNAAAMTGAQMQGVAMTPWGGIAPGNANPYPGWGAQAGNMNQNIGWGGAVQGDPGQGNNNMNWNSSNGNPDWSNQQRDNGGRHSGNRGAFNAGDSGGRSWKPRSGGDEGPRRRICYEFQNQGVCRRHTCNYAHPGEGNPSRNDRNMDRQHSGNERRYANHNERNDRQFDRQALDNERHHDRHDSRHNDRDDGRPDDNQADRSQSREPC